MYVYNGQRTACLKSSCLSVIHRVVHVKDKRIPVVYLSASQTASISGHTSCLSVDASRLFEYSTVLSYTQATSLYKNTLAVKRSFYVYSLHVTTAQRTLLLIFIIFYKF